MLRSVFKDVIIYSFNSFLAKGIAFFLIPVFTSILVPSEYGIIDTFLILSSLVRVFVGFEIMQAIARFYLETPEAKRPSFVSTAFVFWLLSYALFLGVMFIFDDYFNTWITEDKELKTVYYIAVGGMTMNAIYQFWQGQLRWALRSKEFTYNSIAYTILTYTLSVIFIVYMDLKLEGYFLATLLSSTLMATYAIYIQRDLLVPVFSDKILRELLSYSTPLVFSSVAIIASNYMDRIVIKDLLSLHDLGVYGVGFRISSMVALLISGVQIALSPLIFNHYQEKETPAKINQIAMVFSFCCFILIAALGLFSREIVAIASEEYYDAWKIIPIIGAATLFANSYIFTPGISLAKKTQLVVYINVSMLLLNLGLNYLLVPYIGFEGAAFSTLFCAIILLSLYAFFSQRLYKIPFDAVFIIVGSIYVAIIIYVFSYVYTPKVFDFNSIIIRTSVIGLFAMFLFFIKKEFFLSVGGKMKSIMLSRIKNKR